MDEETHAFLNEKSIEFEVGNWTMLYLNGGKINNLQQEKVISITNVYKDPVKSGYTFVGWYIDPALTKRRDPAKFYPQLYAGYK